MVNRVNVLVLFVVSLVTLGVEVLLTRIFAVILFSNHSFLAISLTLLGTGAGAILAYLSAKTPEEKQEIRQAWLLVFLALAVLISFYVLLQIEFVPRSITDPETGEMTKDLTFNQRNAIYTMNPAMFDMWKLYAVVPVIFLPFLFAGYIQAFVFRHAAKKFAVLYGVDLLAATVGAVSIPLLLYPFGLQGTIIAIEMLIFLPLLYILLLNRRNWKLWTAIASPVLLLVIFLVFGGFTIRHAAGFSDKKTIREYWTPMARVALMEYKKNREMYMIDNSSRTYYATYNEKDIKRYNDSLYTVPFEMKKDGRLMVIASGGGQELIMAHHYGIKEIDAVEIAGPIIRDIVNEKKDEPGNPYLLPGVNYFIADGRSVVMRSQKKYDIIEMLEVNFHTMAGQIAQAWSPYFVFTQEAFSEYLEHLKADGYLCYTFFSRGAEPTGGDKGRRFRSVVAGMLVSGIKEPEKHFVLTARPFGYGYRSMVMAKPTPFTEDELLQIARVSDSRKAHITIQYPDLAPLMEKGLITEEEYNRWQPNKGWVKRVAKMCTDARQLKGLWFNVKHAHSFSLGTNDDRPYLYGAGIRAANSPQEKLIRDMYRNLFIIMGVLAIVFIIMPLVVKKSDTGGKVRMDFRLLMILLLTGLGFMFLEMAGIYRFQLYMQHPTTALITILSGMILGAGLGSLHSDRIILEKKQQSIMLYATLSAVYGGLLLVLAPMLFHRLMLQMPLAALLIASFILFAGLGFLLGHVVPLSVGAFAGDQGRLVAWCWAITATGSVFGTVLASVVSREYGMFLVSLLGVACYLLIVVTVLLGMAVSRWIGGRTAAQSS